MLLDPCVSSITSAQGINAGGLSQFDMVLISKETQLSFTQETRVLVGKFFSQMTRVLLFSALLDACVTKTRSILANVSEYTC